MLINAVAQMREVVAIGKSGGSELPDAKQSDIDVFVFCRSIPSVAFRQAAIDTLLIVSGSRISDTEDRFWGVCDYVILEDAEICLMYFSVDTISTEIEAILQAERLDKEGNYFYPTGRCATMLSMHALYDTTGFIDTIKEKLYVYPPDLAEKIIEHHAPQMNDAEDFSRALLRKDVLFYHCTLDKVLDHFLQVLFALNRCYFPSRKRSLQFIETFSIKPSDCPEKLLQAVALGGRPETLPQSYQIWESLCSELEGLIKRTE